MTQERRRAQPKCYASELGDCCDQLSAEHFFSLGVIEILNVGPTFRVSGFPWQRQAPSLQPSPRTLVARILCREHNSRLSALDSEALRLFNFFEEAPKVLEAGKGRLSYEVDGCLFERWVLKALIGAVASGNAARGDERIPKSKPPISWLRWLYGLDEEMPTGWGLYMTSRLDDRVMNEKFLEMAPLSDGEQIFGCSIGVHGFRFVLAMSSPPEGPLLEGSIFHPSSIRFVHNKYPCSAELILRWHSKPAGRGVQIAFHPDGPPPSSQSA